MIRYEERNAEIDRWYAKAQKANLIGWLVSIPIVLAALAWLFNSTPTLTILQRCVIGGLAGLSGSLAVISIARRCMGVRDKP